MKHVFIFADFCRWCIIASTLGTYFILHQQQCPAIRYRKCGGGTILFGLLRVSPPKQGVRSDWPLQFYFRLEPPVHGISSKGDMASAARATKKCHQHVPMMEYSFVYTVKNDIWPRTKLSKTRSRVVAVPLATRIPTRMCNKYARITFYRVLCF